MSRYGLLALGTFWVGSCASIFSSPTTKVLLISNPPGCPWETDLGQRGITPSYVFLPNGREVVIRFTRPGQVDSSLEVVSRPGQSVAIVGNLILGGLVGVVMDAANPNTKMHASVIEVDVGELTEADATRTDL